MRFETRLAAPRVSEAAPDADAAGEAAQIAAEADRYFRDLNWSVRVAMWHARSRQQPRPKGLEHRALEAPGAAGARC